MARAVGYVVGGSTSVALLNCADAGWPHTPESSGVLPRNAGQFGGCSTPAGVTIPFTSRSAWVFGVSLIAWKRTCSWAKRSSQDLLRWRRQLYEKWQMDKLEWAVNWQLCDQFWIISLLRSRDECLINPKDIKTVTNIAKTIQDLWKFKEQWL